MSRLWTKAELNKVIGGSVETAIHKLVNNPKLPEELSEILTDYTFTKNNIGCSSAGVYHCQNSSGSLYLKIEKSNNEFRREFEIMKWLDGKLPVPQIRYYGEHGEFSYLLMTEANGHMSCECPEDELCKPYETTVRLLAEGLLMLQSIDIVECPFENSLDTKLKDAFCVRSIGYNLRNCDGKDKYVDLLFEYLKFEPDWDKINYYILLDELF